MKPPRPFFVPDPWPLTPGPCERPRSRGFTLIELLITVSIIAIMASMLLFALYSAQESAKASKTRALITKLDAIIKAKYESYQTRRVPLTLQPDEFVDLNHNGTLEVGDFIDANQNGVIDPGELVDITGDGSPEPYVDSNGNMTVDASEWHDFNSNGTADPGEAIDFNNNGLDVADFTDLNGNGTPDVFTSRPRARLDGLRDLMRMEMPDRWTDVTSNPYAPIERPTLSQRYLSRYGAGTPPSGEFQGAECLYLIVMAAMQEEGDGREVFKADSIGDVDGDGFQEFIDGWGKPIRWLRWAPGFVSDLAITARGLVTDATGTGSKTITVKVAGSGLSRADNAYVGYTMAQMGTPGGRSFLGAGRGLARITGYQFIGTEGVFTFHTPDYTPQKPFTDEFGSGTPGVNNEVVILGPDGFDSGSVYPIYNPSSDQPPGPPNTSVTPFAMYPLIYSAGPNGYFGISTGALSLNYADPSTIGMYPFAAVDSTSDMVGAQTQTAETPNVFEGWKDNIHNHQLGQK